MSLINDILIPGTSHYYGKNSETNIWYKNLLSTGGYITQSQFSLVDTFVTTLKNNNIWTKLELVKIFVGGLNGCSAKLKYRSDDNPFSQIRGFKSMDYSDNLGLTGDGFTKDIATGFKISNSNITTKNISFGFYSTTTNCSTIGIPMGTNYSVGGVASGFFLSNCSSSGQPMNSLLGFTQPASSQTRGLVSLIGNSSSVNTYQGFQQRDTKAVASLVTPFSQLNIFSYNGGFYYAGSISGVYIGTALTASELTILSNAFDVLNIGLGRNVSSNRNLFFGDSITFGTINELAPLQGNFTTQRWSTIVNNALGGIEFNSGISGTTVQNTTPNLPGNGRNRYGGDILGPAPSNIFMIYGLNDGRYNGASFTVGDYETQLGEIVQGMIDFGIPPQSIRIGSPYYNDPAFYASYSPYNALTLAKQQAYRDSTANVAVAKGTKYTDIYQYMLDNGSTTLLGPDGVHMNVAGHAIVAQQMLLAA